MADRSDGLRNIRGSTKRQPTFLSSPNGRGEKLYLGRKTRKKIAGPTRSEGKFPPTFGAVGCRVRGRVGRREKRG